MKIEVIKVENEQQLSNVRTLIKEYVDSLVSYISNLDFKTELGLYNKEAGYLQKLETLPYTCILLGFVNDCVAGCVALKKLDDNTGEIKRLYVKPEYRNRNLGKILCTSIIKEAETKGFHCIKIETSSTMTKAIAMYKSFGFYEKNPTKYSPIIDTLYLEILLTKNQN